MSPVARIPDSGGRLRAKPAKIAANMIRTASPDAAPAIIATLLVVEP